jgi:hypothetical protein
MTSSSTQKWSPAEVSRVVTDYDVQIRRGIEDGSIRGTMKAISSGLVSRTIKLRLGFTNKYQRTMFSLKASDPAIANEFPARLFLFRFLNNKMWKTRGNYTAEAFNEYLRTELRIFDDANNGGVAQSDSTPASEPVHDTKPLLATPVPSAPTPARLALVIPALVVPAPVPAPAVLVSADPADHANPVPIVPTIAGPEIATSTIPKTVPSKPAGIFFGPPPPRTATRNEVPMIPAVSKSGVTQSAAFTSAAGPSDIKSGAKSTRWINSKRICEEFPSEDSDQPAYEVERHAMGLGNQKRRAPRAPVREDECHDPPCGRCTRAKRSCFKEVGGGACYGCVKLKSRCEYSKGGLYKDVYSEERAVRKERKGKAKATTQRKIMDFILKEDPHPRSLKSQLNRVEISDDDEEVKIIKQPTRCTKPAVAVTPQQLPSPERMYSFHSCMSSY